MKRITQQEFDALPGRGRSIGSKYDAWIKSLELDKSPVVLSCDELPDGLKKCDEPRMPSRIYPILKGAIRKIYGKTAKVSARRFPNRHIALSLVMKEKP